MYLERAAGLSRLSGWAGAPVFRRLSHCGLLPGEGAYGMCDLHLFYRLCPAAKRYAPEPAVGRGGRAGAPGAAGPECPVLAKWLWLLFWLVIPSVFSNILTMDTVAGAFPTAGVVGNVLAFLISLAYGVLLWQLREAAGRYRTAALCYLAGGIISGVLLLPAIPEGNWLWWLLSLPVMVLELCAAYQEFYAHAEVLEELDPELAGKWRLLWKWWIGLLLGLFGCIFLALISAILGLLAILADAIGLLVVGIVKLVYLYRTAKRFREYQPAALQKEVL